MLVCCLRVVDSRKYDNALKVKKYKKTSRATSSLDTGVVLECVLI